MTIKQIAASNLVARIKQIAVVTANLTVSQTVKGNSNGNKQRKPQNTASKHQFQAHNAG